jgi:hypothetical protein
MLFYQKNYNEKIAQKKKNRLQKTHLKKQKKQK